MVFKERVFWCCTRIFQNLGSERKKTAADGLATYIEDQNM